MPHPENPGGNRPVDEVLAEYMKRVDAGEAVDRREFIERHPKVADELRSYFADADAVDDMVGFERRPLDPRLAASSRPEPTNVIRYFGDYELLEEIGRGGMGVVYKARQCSLNRIVAVKMMLAGQFARQADVDRFRREAEAAANLKHPNIVPIHEIGQDQGHHYFSMDYIEGRSLQEISRDGPLSATKAAGYALTVAQAIAYAHQRGTLHRDLKPSNIVIDTSDQPHVTDFGLARQLGQDSSLTADNELLGSPSYMSPEQAEGRHSEIGPATDVYAMGATLYALTTGRPPFQAATRDATRMDVIHAAPVPPRRLNPAIEPELEAICIKCLAKNPRQRYASADELAMDLRHYLEGLPTGTRPPALPIRPDHRSMRRWVVAGIGTAIVALLLILPARHLFTTTSDESVLARPAVDHPVPEPRTVMRTNTEEEERVAVLALPPARDAGDGAPSPPTEHVDGTMTIRADRGGTYQAAASDPFQQHSISTLDETLAPFGQIPKGWKQVGQLRTDHQEIERDGITVRGDFALQLTLTADRQYGSGIAVVLVGAEGGADLRIEAFKANSWSGVDTWNFQTPSGSARKGLVPGTRTLSLRREGDLFVLSADAVFNPGQGGREISQFVAGDCAEFQAIRLGTTGPGIRLERIRLDATPRRQ